MPRRFRFFEARPDWGAVFIRLMAGTRLLWGTADNVVSWQQMLHFRDFLAAQGLPVPLLGAVVSVAAQFACGLLFVLGLWTRGAAAVMVVNFVVAILLVHIGDTFLNTFDAIAMLASALFLLFHGAGAFSLDRRLAARRAATLV